MSVAAGAEPGRAGYRAEAEYACALAHAGATRSEILWPAQAVLEDARGRHAGCELPSPQTVLKTPWGRVEFRAGPKGP